MRLLPTSFASHLKDSTSLKHRTFSAGAWALVSYFVSLSLRFIGTLILSRIFDPSTFGILAVITTVQVVIALLTDIGLRQTVVQSKSAEVHEFLDTAWTLQIFRGVFVWLMAATLAAILYLAVRGHLVPLNSVYSTPGLPLYLAVAAVSAIFYGFQSMKAIVASRSLNLRQVSVNEIVAQSAGLIFVVIAGWLTRSLWAYIASQLLTAALVSLLSHLALKGRSDRLGYNRIFAAEFFRFGRWTFMSSAMSALSSNGDRLLLASWISPQVLGYYSIAYNLASLADGLLGRMFVSVAFPALSEAARNQTTRVPEIFFRMKWLTDSALLFMAGLLFSSGEAIVDLLYDPRYASAGWMLKCLSFSLVFSRYGLTQNAYMALGRPEYLTILSVTKIVSLFTLAPLGFFFFGVEGAVAGIAFHQAPAALWTFFLNRKYNLNSLRVEAGVLLAWGAGWLMGAAFFALRALLH